MKRLTVLAILTLLLGTSWPQQPTPKPAAPEQQSKDQKDQEGFKIGQPQYHMTDDNSDRGLYAPLEKKKKKIKQIKIFFCYNRS